jgi:hypothetical protein
MKKDEKYITVNGKLCVTTAVAAMRLGVTQGRVLHFIHEKRLSSIQLEEGGTHYIEVESLENLEKIERPIGRPSTKTSIKPPAEKASKKTTKKGTK